jgi:hypothetical protein
LILYEFRNNTRSFNGLIHAKKNILEGMIQAGQQGQSIFLASSIYVKLIILLITEQALVC